MPLLPVHEMELDRATSRLELSRINPTRSFSHVELKEDGHWAGTPATYHYQNGKWYDTGQNEIIDPEHAVPQKFRDEIAQNPLTAGLPNGPSVTAVCKHCGEKMNQSEIEQHYVEHMAQLMAQIGTTPAPKPDIPGKPEKTSAAANTHGRG
jgi:hypothetical protein